MSPTSIINYIKEHVLEILIILLLLFLIIGAWRKESYVGSPLSAMTAWTSGGRQRRDAQIFSASNQGESMVGHKDPPYYISSPYYSNKYQQDYKTDSYVMRTPADSLPKAAQAAPTGPPKEGFTKNAAIDESYLSSVVR